VQLTAGTLARRSIRSSLNCGARSDFTVEEDGEPSIILASILAAVANLSKLQSQHDVMEPVSPRWCFKFVQMVVRNNRCKAAGNGSLLEQCL
jgi:hypothetical protein